MGSSSRNKKCRTGSARPKDSGPPPWNHEIVLEVLAYLPSAAKQQLETADFHEGISQDLEQRFGVHYPPGTIQGRLRRLFGNSGQGYLKKKDFPLVYKLGSKIFDYVATDEDLAWVAQREAEIAQRRLYDFRGSARKLRSLSRSPAASQLERTPTRCRSKQFSTPLRQVSLASGGSDTTLQTEETIEFSNREVSNFFGSGITY